MGPANVFVWVILEPDLSNLASRIAWDYRGLPPCPAIS
jgi:hypothetical protein